MTDEQISALLAQVREATSAMQEGEIARANELLRASRLAELTAEQALPLDARGDELRVAVAGALQLSLELQQAKRAAISQGSNTRRALGAYSKRSR